ncbi:YbaN family protein [Lysobacter sp. CA196]|uniref:YbaN family protein n=1 Tax=Lysobacter sp. CA196 TaxID=3455606 RepID=UPI003F8D8A79
MPFPPPPVDPEPPTAPAADVGEGRPASSKGRTVRFRWAWKLLAYASLALGVIGIVVPGLPTVPFVLLSAFAAGRGSERLHAWLLGHRQFGPIIRDWEKHGAVSRRSKWLAVSMMSVCAVIMFLTSPKLWMAMTGTAIMTVVAVWLWRRPEPPRT